MLEQETLCKIVKRPNKQIKSFAAAHWDAQKAARPLFKRYKAKP